MFILQREALESYVCPSSRHCSFSPMKLTLSSLLARFYIFSWSCFDVRAICVITISREREALTRPWDIVLSDQLIGKTFCWFSSFSTLHWTNTELFWVAYQKLSWKLTVNCWLRVNHNEQRKWIYAFRSKQFLQD